MDRRGRVMKRAGGLGVAMRVGGMSFGGLVLLAGCAPEMGRRPGDTDIACLRAQMGTPVAQSFPLAANMCQRMTDHGLVIGSEKPRPIPLNLRGAPDLQQLAAWYGYRYTR